MLLAITNASTIDPATETLQENRTIVVEGGNIRAIEAGPAPASADRVVNARGRYILPGLVDAHVHFASFAGSHDQELLGETPETVVASTLRGAASAYRMLASGVTAVRDLGCKHAGIFALRRSFSSREHKGPTLIVAGAGITMTGGMAIRSSALEADGADGVRRAVRARVRAGADVVKFFISGGILHPSSSAVGVQYTRDELAAGIAEAHRVGKPVAVHASRADAIELAVELGANTIEHGHEITDAIARRMAEQGTFLVPTLWHYRRVAVHGKDMGFSDSVRDRAREISDMHAQSFAVAQRANVSIAAGTDSGGPQYPSGSFHLELQYMGDLGMKPLEVLRSATSVAAKCLGLERWIGRLTPEFAADLIGVSDDPLDNLATLGSPWLVVKAGEIIRAES